MTLSVHPDTQARLLELTAIDTEIIIERRRMSEMTAEVNSLESDDAYHRLVREAENAADRVDDVTREKDHVSADIETARARIARDKQRETVSSDSKELVALESEIESLERRIDKLEQQQHEIVTRWTSLTDELTQLTAERDAFHESRSERQNQLRAEIATKEHRISLVGQDRERLTGDLPSELVELYERQRERYGVGASLLTRGISTASGVALTPYQLDVVKNADPFDVLMCPDSTAILIRTAESGI